MDSYKLEHCPILQAPSYPDIYFFVIWVNNKMTLTVYVSCKISLGRYFSQ